jgi:hypothetical protein
VVHIELEYSREAAKLGCSLLKKSWWDDEKIWFSWRQFAIRILLVSV